MSRWQLSSFWQLPLQQSHDALHDIVASLQMSPSGLQPIGFLHTPRLPPPARVIPRGLAEGVAGVATEAAVPFAARINAARFADAAASRVPGAAGGMLTRINSVNSPGGREP